MFSPHTNTPVNSSRRRFLGMAGAAAASASLLDVMTGAAPASAATPAASTASARPAAANGRTVAILGAGPAGLGAALRLVAAGYEVTVLEAQGRVGGRTIAARRGDVITEVWEDGSRHTQTCAFDDGLYLNLGAGRIPYHHQRVLGLCRSLKVPIQPYIHTSTANVYQTDDAWSGATMANRRIANDTRGFVAEFAARAVAKGSQAEDGLTDGQRARLLSLLDRFGVLDAADHTYHGSTRSGLAEPLSVQQMEEPVAPLRLADLLASRFWDHGFYQDSDFKWQTTLFQPVGGMDQIWRYAQEALPSGTVRFNAEVTAIELGSEGVRVEWDNDGSPASGRFDYCLSNIPVSVLRARVALRNFSEAFTEAVYNTPYAAACKVGWQANRRFWESDRYQIFGGISRIDHVIEQIWYPSNDYFSPTDKGTLTGAYSQYENAVTIGDMPHEERLRVAREGATKLHDEFASDAIVPNRLGMSVAWTKAPFQLGAWAGWERDHNDHKRWYETLLYPQGEANNFLVIGDQVSALPGWQEGALMSAEWAAGWITRGARTLARQPVRQTPDARELTTGLP